MLESLNYSFRNPKNIIWVIYRIKQLRNYKKNHGVLRGTQLGKQRWRPRLGILRVNKPIPLVAPMSVTMIPNNCWNLLLSLCVQDVRHGCDTRNYQYPFVQLFFVRFGSLLFSGVSLKNIWFLLPANIFKFHIFLWAPLTVSGYGLIVDKEQRNTAFHIAG